MTALYSKMAFYMVLPALTHLRGKENLTLYCRKQEGGNYGIKNHKQQVHSALAVLS